MVLPRAICICWFVVVTLTTICASPADARYQGAGAEAEQAYQLAAGFYQRGQWEEATEAFEEIVKQYPSTEQAAIAHFFLGESLIQNANHQAALAAYQNYLTQLPDHEFSGRALFRMGEASMRLEELTKSIRLLESFVNQYPNDLLVQFGLAYLGEMRLTRDEPQLAQMVFERSLQVRPDGELANQCRFGLARSLQIQGYWADADRFYDFIINEPNNPLTVEATLQKGIIKFAVDDFEKATELLSHVVANSNDSQNSGEAHYWLARIAMNEEDITTAFDHFAAIETSKVKQDLAVATWFDGAVAATDSGHEDQAADWLETLCHAVPQHELADDSLRLRIRLAQKHDEKELVTKLTESFLATHETSPFTTEVLEIAGRNAYAMNDFTRTIEIFSKLLTSEDAEPVSAATVDQRNTWAYFQSLGHMGLDEFRNAESLLKSIVTLEETASLKPLVEIALATVRFAQKNYAAAILGYRQYLALLPNGPAADQARLELTLALAQTEEWDAAENAFENWAQQHEAQEDIGKTAQILARLARTSTITNKPGAAAEYWYRKMADEENSADVAAQGLSGLAWLKTEHGNRTASAAAFTELLDRYPSHPQSAEAGITLGKLLETRDDFEQAAVTYGKVVKHFPNTDLGRLAKLRSAYLLQRIGNRVSLEQARESLAQWLNDSANEQADSALRAEATYQLGWVLNDLGNRDGRDEQFTRLVKTFPASKYWPDAAYRLAESHLSAKRYVQSETLLKKLMASQQCPENILIRALYLQGQTEAGQQDWPAASRSFKSLVSKADDKGILDKATYWLAESLYRQDRFEESKVKFQQLHDDQQTTVNESLKPWIELRLAQCFGKNEQWSAAAATSRIARQRFADFQMAYEYDFMVARGLEDAGQLTDAIREYQTVIDSRIGGDTETAAMAQWRIGEVYFHQEKYGKAIGAYYRVDSIFSYPHWRSAALLQAGKCQEYLKNWKHAEKLYRQLLDKFPNSDFASDATLRLNQVQVVANQNANNAKQKKQR